MFHIVLYQPEIPPNTGNIIRLCANTGASLHLIQPLGFRLTDRQLQRSGLDYHDLSNVALHNNWEECKAHFTQNRCFIFSTKGKRLYSTVNYQKGDVFLFGSETRGVPQTLLESFTVEHRLRLPMQPHNRSLNLSNAVAIALYEAWKQINFLGSECL